jgi:hypothetical protein
MNKLANMTPNKYMDSTKFEIIKYSIQQFDNVKGQCHVCNKILLRNIDCCRWVYNPKTKYYPVTHFFVCSEECGQMYILQNL